MWDKLEVLDDGLRSGDLHDEPALCMVAFAANGCASLTGLAVVAQGFSCLGYNLGLEGFGFA